MIMKMFCHNKFNFQVDIFMKVADEDCGSVGRINDNTLFNLFAKHEQKIHSDIHFITMRAVEMMRHCGNIQFHPFINLRNGNNFFRRSCSESHE